MSLPKLMSVRREGSTLIVAPRGSVSSLAGAIVQPELDELLDRIEIERIRSVVFDLADVNYFGSLMLAAMHAVWKRIRTAQGKMALSNVSDLGRDILRIARFDQLWAIYPTLDEALAAVAPTTES
jgi:anti-anti-sigma factor